MPMDGSANGHGRIHSLDGLRGLAAMAVVCFHLLDVFDPFTAGSNVGKKNLYGFSFAAWAQKFPVAWMFNGVFAVSIFFMLSGFVLTYVLLVAKNDSRRVELVAQRFFRLFPVVCVGSVLAFVVLRFGWTQLDAMYAFNHATQTNVYDPRILPPSLWEMLSQIFYDVWRGGGTRTLYDRVLWTIGMEFQASVVLLAMFTLLLRSKSRVFAHFIVTITGLLVCGSSFFFFAAGSILCELHVKQAMPKFLKNAIVLTILTIIALCLASIHPKFDGRLWFWPIDFEGAREYSLAISNTAYLFASASLVLAALYLKPLRWLLTTPPVQGLGYISYALYAIHQPLVYSLGAATYLHLNASHGFRFAAAAIAVVVVASILAFIITRWIDLPFNRLSKRWVASRMSMGSALTP